MIVLHLLYFLRDCVQINQSEQSRTRSKHRKHDNIKANSVRRLRRHCDARSALQYTCMVGKCKESCHSDTHKPATKHFVSKQAKQTSAFNSCGEISIEGRYTTRPKCKVVENSFCYLERTRQRFQEVQLSIFCKPCVNGGCQFLKI